MYFRKYFCFPIPSKQILLFQHRKRCFYIEKAAKDAQAHDFIMELSEKYQTVVGERGLGLSGGQKQRVSIARALLKNAPVLVLDDSTSALDMGTEKKLLKTIKEDYPEKSVLISAHRMSSLVDCDEIIYMQNGKIVERGTFEELMKAGGHFAKVYEIQENQRKSAIDYEHCHPAQRRYSMAKRNTYFQNEVIEKKIDVKQLGRILKYVLPYQKIFSLVGVLMLVAACTSLISPLLLLLYHQPCCGRERLQAVSPCDFRPGTAGGN